MLVYLPLLAAAVLSQNGQQSFQKSEEKSSEAYAGAMIAFGSRLLSVAAKDSKQNVFVSPMSAHLAFTILANGTTGESKDQLVKVLGFPIDQLNLEAAELMKRTKISGSPLTIANSIWSLNDAEFAPSFVNSVTHGLHAEVANVSSDGGAETINNWIKKETHGTIEKALEEISQQDRLVLVNALAFDGKWEQKFNESDTREADFGEGETKSKAKMMRLVAKVRCGDWEKRKVAFLPYEGKFGMLLILPAEGEAPSKVVTDLNANNWTALPSVLKLQKAIISFPKFKINSSINIKQYLKELGLPKLKAPGSDLDGMLTKPENLSISQALQKTFIEVDEKGTKASATTVIVSGGYGGGGGEQVFTFYANRPFVCALIERGSDLPIMLGIVNKP